MVRRFCRTVHRRPVVRQNIVSLSSLVIQDLWALSKNLADPAYSLGFLERGVGSVPTFGRRKVPHRHCLRPFEVIAGQVGEGGH